MPILDWIGKKTVAFEKCSSVRNIIVLCIVLSVITLSVYVQVANHEFISYDDMDYVASNPHVTSGITVENVMWAFASVGGTTCNWHPITWLSHMADVQVYGMNPGAHHITNVVIHIASSVILLLLLFRVTGALWQSAFVAAMFALHPMHVESVAWVAERKDVLSAFFWFLTLFFYSEYVAKRTSALYILALVSFALGLMSKSMLVTLPIAMLLIDYWPLGRYRHNDQKQRQPQLLGTAIALIKEKIPFFACSLLTCIVTIYTQAGVITSLSLQLRIENALTAYLRYIGKTLWPHDLALLYPIHFPLPIWQIIGSLIFLLFVSAAAIATGRRYPYLAVGWFWFIITLIPVIGLVQVGVQSMADRYSYIPLIGLFVMMAWGIPDSIKGLKNREGILAVLTSAVIIASTALTWQQLRYWSDSISLYEHTLHVTTGNYVIHNNLGVILLDNGNLDKAIREFKESIRIKPRYIDAHTNLGVALVGKGDLDAAMQEFLEVIRRDPNNAQAHNNLGFVLASKKDFDAAIVEYQEALRVNPADTRAHENLEAALAQKRMQDEARK